VAEGDRERVGVVVGTGVGNLDVIESAAETLRSGARLSPASRTSVFATRPGRSRKT